MVKPKPSYQEVKLKKLVRFSFLALSFLLSVVICLSWLVPSPTNDISKAHLSSSSLRQSKPRIAVLLPFLGSFPPYLNTFCLGAAGSFDIADFIIIHNGLSIEGLDCPANVKFVDLQSTVAFANHLLRVVVDDDGEPSKKASIQVAKYIETYPYSLVEFKPALGHIFRSLIEGYSHWAYSDVDILFGDLGRWITPTELQDFDIVTYGFGDQHRLYLRGQFTFHKNRETINQLWRGCDYLAKLDERIDAAVHGNKKYHFESAEGCYSAVVMQRQDIRIKFAVKAWTDVSEEDTAYSHGLYLARSKKRPAVIYKAASQDDGTTTKALIESAPTWFEKDSVYRKRHEPLQKEVGAMQELALPNDESAHCMYWVQKKYQKNLCLGTVDVEPTDTVYWVDGKLYKQRYENVPLETRGIITGPFFHFQEWKRYYRSDQVASMHLSSPMSLFVLTKEGAVPVNPGDQVRYHKKVHGLPSPLRQHTKKWKPVTQGDRTALPVRSYCLISGPRRHPPVIPAPECHLQVSWSDHNVMILSGAPEWNTVTIDSDVTLVLTMQLTALQARNKQSLSDISEIVVENLSRWQGRPCVVLFHVAGATEEVVDFLHHRFGPNSDLSSGIDNSLISAIFHEQEDTISRKALLNMASDAVPTRWYISGIELERGLILSEDAVYFSYRAVVTHEGTSGNVILLPQFALTEGDSTSLTLNEMLEKRENFELKSPSEIENACDDDRIERLASVETLWWDSVKHLVAEKSVEESETLMAQRSEAIQSIETSLLYYLTDEHHLKMFALDESPILLLDNLGPVVGMRTDELVRDIDELGGRRCYNGLRLAQFAALGYKLDVLVGAFAVSSEATRNAPMAGLDQKVLGTSRCDGCFMFEEEDEEVLEIIVRSEIKRPVKTAVLWQEQIDKAIQ